MADKTIRPPESAAVPAKLTFTGEPDGPEKDAPVCGEVIDTEGIIVSAPNAIFTVIEYQFWLPALSVTLP